MSKNRHRQQQSPDRQGQPPAARSASARREVRFPVFVRLLVSVLLIWHLSAVFLAPLSIPPSSTAVVEIAQGSWMQKYLDMLYINHGYHFFAPDPGDGHVVRYEVFDQAGNLIADGEFPNREAYWPRLRYHRYFMLADQSEFAIPDQELRERWLRIYLEKYAQQLLREYGGESARVRRYVHYHAYRDDVLEGMPLDAPETYELQMEVTQRRADVQATDAAYLRARGRERNDVASEGWEGAMR